MAKYIIIILASMYVLVSFLETTGEAGNVYHAYETEWHCQEAISYHGKRMLKRDTPKHWKKYYLRCIAAKDFIPPQRVKVY